MTRTLRRSTFRMPETFCEEGWTMAGELGKLIRIAACRPKAKEVRP